MELLGLFLEQGGHWLTLVAALALVAATGIQEDDGLRRFRTAFSTRLFGLGAPALALAAWVEQAARLQWGDRFLRGAGALPWLSALVLGVVLVLVGTAWLAAHRWPRARPCLTLGIVLVLILGAGRLTAPGPDATLGPGDRGPAVLFVQNRLAGLGCYEAAGEMPESDGTFDTATQMAVISFQQANGFDRPRVDLPFLGLVRPDHEWQRLKALVSAGRACGAEREKPG